MTYSDMEVPDFRILVLSGPAGSGKTTIVNRLVRESPVKLVKAVSATTRPARQGETHGEDYYFLPDEEFQRRKANGEFLEVAEVHGSGYWYGTLRSELQRARREGGWAFLEIDVEGALHAMAEFPDAITIFLTTPSDEEYEKRLRARGTESEEAINRRMQTARNELKQADRYRYRVVNDDLDVTIREISDILSREQSGDRTRNAR
ncbi:MAG: guanylate kinase [Planctomycetaceae bacterium]